MDDVLKRILSLLPKKENGEYAHGAKADFCKKIGIKNQTLSDWIAGRSNSYEGKLYEIAGAYHVSVGWLRTGEDADEALEKDRQQWMEERELLQIIRDKDLRNLMAGFKGMSMQQIKMMERFMKAISEGDDAD